MSKYKIYGISEAFNHALEWRSRGADSMIQRNVSPALRATDYKCPKYVWLIKVEDETESEDRR
jgi:hypothetical protein